MQLATCEHIADRSTATQTALPMVSIIIPVRNDAERLDVCLRSLSNQSYDGDRYEIIVVDNGSVDDSAGVAEKHGAKVLRFPGLRVGALRNRGVEQARGEIVAFVDSDHELPPTWVRSGVDGLLRSPTARVIGAPCLAPANGTWVQRGWEWHRLRNHRRRAVPWLGAGNMFLRRTQFEAAGGFSEGLVAAEDVDLCVRLDVPPGSIVSDPSIANTHHGEPATLSAFFWKEYWRGSSGLRAFFAHGMPLHELPSLAYPLYHLLAGLLLITAIGAAAMFSQPLLFVAGLLIIVLPSMLLAAKTSWGIRRPFAFLPLAALYLTYGCARAAALFKR
jgi:GT2 family glycosyltransferase